MGEARIQKALPFHIAQCLAWTHRNVGGLAWELTPASPRDGWLQFPLFTKPTALLTLKSDTVVCK